METRLYNKSAQVAFKALDKDALERVAKARRIARETQPITGTLAEKYLRKVRGIKGLIPNSCSLLKKKCPSLGVLAHNLKKSGSSCTGDLAKF